MEKTLAEIAELIDGVLEGDGSIVVTGVAGIKEAGPGEITFVANPKYVQQLTTTRASAVIVDHRAPACETNLIRTDNPYLAFTQVLKLFAVEVPKPKGIHPGAIIGQNVSFGEEVAIHAGAVVGDDCVVGHRSLIYPGVTMGHGSVVGSDCIIYPRVVIADSVLIGNRVIIHSGAVIGSQPLPVKMAREGLAPKEAEAAVVIEDDCEIGAGVTIDFARKTTTVVRSGTKIDNLVHIGSDSEVGRNCIIVSQAGVGSECKIGDGAVIAGQAGVIDGIEVGAGTTIAARSGVTESVGANLLISGTPPASHDKWRRIYASLLRLPTVMRDVRDFKKRLDGLEHLEDAQAKDD